jgi:hypothetical protein
MDHAHVHGIDLQTSSFAIPIRDGYCYPTANKGTPASKRQASTTEDAGSAVAV